MTVWTLGSINADLIYRVAHLPAPGETIAALDRAEFLGGKGANMSVAAARAAAHVVHIGAVGSDAGWTVDRLLEYGVDTRFIRKVDASTGHAIISVDAQGENQIIIHPGANRAIPEALVLEALSTAPPGGFLMIQNETNAQGFAAKTGSDKGMRVVYAAAPFDEAAVRAVLPHIDMLVLNAVEAAQLETALGAPLAGLGVADVVITLGAEGCRWIHAPTGEDQSFPAYPVTPVDTTGAGDTFTGYLVAGLDRGMPMAQSISQAQRAAAIMVTRSGTADVIPDLRDVQDAILG